MGPDDNIVVALPDLEIIESAIAPTDRDRVLDWARANLKRLVEQRSKGNPTVPVRMQ